MGSGGSYSKRKSSKKKRDKTSQKKKSKRKESKKRSRDYDSVSSYSDDELSNSECSSSPILKSHYKRKNRKSKKLRSRDHSVSSDSNDISKVSDSDSDYKKSKKPRRSKSKNNKPKKRHISSDSDEDAHRSRKRKRSTRDPRKKSSKKKLKKHVSSSSSSDSQSYDEPKRSKVLIREEIDRKPEIGSPSCSSFSRDDDIGDHIVSVGYSYEALAPVNNSRRLKSVITVVNRSHEEDDILEKDPNKEEIVYDYNDYPSPKSLDSNEEDYQKDLVNPELEKSGIQGDYQMNNVHVDNFEMEKESNVPVPVAALGENDLESKLRQKALENLRKFKGKLQKGPTSSTVDISLNNENSIKGSSSSEKAGTIENKPTNQGKDSTQVPNMRSGLELERDLSCVTEIKEEHVKQERVMAKQIVTQSSNEDNSTSSKAVLVQVEPSDIIQSAVATSKPISEENSLEGQQNESKDSSQFEQKTMAVMRGGELVQVSYKVYIPKRAPALGRRQLRR